MHFVPDGVMGQILLPPPTGNERDGQGGSDLLTIKEIANHLGCHYMTVLKYVHSGKMLGVRVGGQWRIHRCELERFKREGNAVAVSG